MRQVVLLTLATLPLVPLFAPHADALACNGAITEVALDVGTLYVDDRGVDTQGIWIYQESNGIAGLQSGGVSLVLGELDRDDCWDGRTEPDTLVV